MEPSSWSKRPAVRVVALYIAGILLSGVVSAPPWVLLSFLSVGLLTLVLLYRHAHSSVSALVAFHLLVILLGLLAATLRRTRIEREIMNPRYYGERVILEGRIESEPVRKSSRSEMLLRTMKIRREATVDRVDQRVLVHVVKTAHWGNPDSLEIGDAVRVTAYLESLPGARNPGEFDYGRYLALNGVQGFVTVRDTNAVILTAKASDLSVSNLMALAQNSIYNMFDHYHRPEEASFLKGVVFGYRGDLTAEVKQSFMDTGTIHILAVSGSNVVVVGLIFYSVIGFFRVSSRTATALTLIGLLWYMIITGLSPSVVRATIMGSVILIGTMLGRKSDVYNSLAVAALAMLLWDPMYLLDVGFLLSFAAVISIVYFYPKLESLIKMIPERFARSKIVDSTLKLFAVSLAAQIGTMPFTAYFFGRVSLIAVLANLLVVPLSGLNTLLGFATIGFSFVSGWVASSYAALNDLLVSLLLKFVMSCSKVPYAYVETLSAGAMAALIYYVCVAALFHVHRPRVLVKAVIVLLMALNISLYSDAMVRAGPSLTMTAIDVGQGDALLLEFPNKRRILVDTGPKYLTYSSAERIIAPLLKKKGIEALDAIVLSHSHDDHVGGCRYLLDKFEVLRLVVADTGTSNRFTREALDAAKRRGVPVQLALAGQTLQFDPTTRIFVLHPTSMGKPTDVNNLSIVLKVVYGASSLLLPGDASQDAENQLVQKGGSFLASDVLKSGHHGAATSSSEGFMRAVRPSLAVISVGRLNRFNHPSRVVLSRYRSLGIDTKRTDLDGAVVVRSDGIKFRVVQWRRSSLL